MIITGTAHFSSVGAAEAYYRPYFVNEVKRKGRKKQLERVSRAVRYKLSLGEIHIGKPILKRGQHAQLDSDGRYHIYG